MAQEEPAEGLPEKHEERPAVDEPEEEEASETPRTGTPHDESDYEDNITVTVPPPHFQSNNSYRDRHLNGRHGRHIRPGGMDDTSKNQHLHVSFRFKYFESLR